MYYFMNVPYRITYVTQVNHEAWQHYAWNIEINGVHFIFKTGLGHKNITGTPKKPTIETVLNCLFMDAEANSMSFQNWCGDLGYNDDSIEHLRIYDLCCKTDRQLRLALKDKYEEIKAHIQSLEL